MSAVELEIEVEAAQSMSARIRATFVGLHGVDPSRVCEARCGHAESAKFLAKRNRSRTV